MTDDPERWPGYLDLSWEERFHILDGLRKDMVQDSAADLYRIKALEGLMEEMRDAILMGSQYDQSALAAKATELLHTRDWRRQHRALVNRPANSEQ